MTIIYDGDCSFCRLWVDWLLEQAKVPLAVYPYSERPAEFKKIPTAHLKRAVHFVDDDGTVLSGAAAVFRVMELRPQGTFFYKLYQKFLPFRFLTDLIYRFIAGHRKLAAWATYFLWGEKVPAVQLVRVRRFFLSGLGLVYLDAFLSLGVQIRGLAGENGIMPAARLAEFITRRLGVSKYLVFPNVMWWGGASDGALTAYCTVGAIFSAFLIFNFFPGLSAAISWFLMLSLTLACGVFLSYQWEELLLEAGFLAIFLAPFGSKEYRPRPVLVWLYRWLLFRLIFSSGLAKLLSGDPNWTGLTALNFHFETQPLPTAIAWYAAHLPTGILEFMTASALFIETFIPLLFFLPRRPRIWAFWFQIFLQVCIALTGNYGYFNLLTMVLCLFLLDDAYLDQFFFRKNKMKTPKVRRKSPWELSKRVALGLVALGLVVTGLAHLKEIVSPAEGFFNKTVEPLVTFTGRYMLCGSYGLFVNMTTEREEIIIEGSEDGAQWLAYGFPYKPGDLSASPRFVAPHQPRLDWQMWFAALGDYENQPWLQNLLYRLLQGQKDVLSLLAMNPFPEKPPKFVRALRYRYHFTDVATKKTTGKWWTRTLIGPYGPPSLSLQQ